MSSKFRIVSDGSCDIPEALAKENDIDIVHFLVSFNSSDYKKEGVDLELAELYQQMVSHPGVYPKTVSYTHLISQLKIIVFLLSSFVVVII